jgi:hypothetical protein
MSTRSAVIVERTDDFGPDSRSSGYGAETYLKHHDGYLTGVGLELVRLLYGILQINSDELETFSGASAAMKDVLSQAYHPATVSGVPGDIQYLYVINFNDGITVTAYCRPRFAEFGNPYEWPKAEIFKVALRPYNGKQVYVIEKVTLALDATTIAKPTQPTEQAS